MGDECLADSAREDECELAARNFLILDNMVHKRRNIRYFACDVLNAGR